MNDTELKRIEKELGIRLPAPYTKIMREFPDEFRNWPDAPGADRSEWFFPDAERLIEVNRQIRSQPGEFVKAPPELRESWPPSLFVFGRYGNNWHVVDVSLEDPPLMEIVEGDFSEEGSNELSVCFNWVRLKHATEWQKHKPPPGRASKSKALAEPDARRAAHRTRAGDGARLTGDELIAEGRRLARPAVALREKGSKYAAVWRGSGVVPAGSGEWRHWISIDTSFLPDNPRKLKGVVSVYEWFADDDRMGDLKMAHDAKASLPRRTDGTRLYAKSFDCPPPVEAVFQFGSKKVKDWAKATSWEPNTGADESPVRDYAEFVRSRHPFESGDGTYAMLGGWSAYFGHCYGTDEEYPWRLLKKALIVLTIAESEPWIEVFDDGRKFVTFSRIT